jgi:hypothetical protein
MESTDQHSDELIADKGFVTLLAKVVDEGSSCVVHCGFLAAGLRVV